MEECIYEFLVVKYMVVLLHLKMRIMFIINYKISRRDIDSCWTRPSALFAMSDFGRAHSAYFRLSYDNVCGTPLRALAPYPPT
jgi:hypothetical protein